MEACVYYIRCVPTNQHYVGTALDWIARIRQHTRKLNKGNHKNWKLQAAWGQHGPTAFEFKQLEICDFKDVLNREHWWAGKLNSKTQGFNLHTLGSHGFQTHGQTHSRAFRSWDAMKQRCTNPNSSDYHRYGGKGVVICKRWLDSFENFLEDMGERPEGTSLDRYPDKHGNYEPNNCRWATPSEQQRNLRNNQYLTYDDQTKLLVDWAVEKEIPIGLLRTRFNNGLRNDQLFAPSYSSFEGIKNANGEFPKRHRRISDTTARYTHQGKTLTLTEWAEELGVDRGTLAQRIEKYKMPLDKALTAAPLKKGKAGPREGHRMITAFGKTQSITAWSRETGISISTLKNRIGRARMAPEAALTASLYAQQKLLRTTSQ